MVETTTKVDGKGKMIYIGPIPNLANDVTTQLRQEIGGLLFSTHPVYIVSTDVERLTP